MPFKIINWQIKSFPGFDLFPSQFELRSTYWLDGIIYWKWNVRFYNFLHWFKLHFRPWQQQWHIWRFSVRVNYFVFPMWRKRSSKWSMHIAMFIKTRSFHSTNKICSCDIITKCPLFFNTFWKLNFLFLFYHESRQAYLTIFAKFFTRFIIFLSPLKPAWSFFQKWRWWIQWCSNLYQALNTEF